MLLFNKLFDRAKTAFFSNSFLISMEPSEVFISCGRSAFFAAISSSWAYPAEGLSVADSFITRAELSLVPHSCTPIGWSRKWQKFHA